MPAVPRPGLAARRLTSTGFRPSIRWRAPLIILAAAAALLPIPRSAVETFYSSRTFPLLQLLITTASNQVPFALFDVLLVVTIGGWMLLAVRDFVGARRAGRLRAAIRIVVRSVTLVASLYLAFLLLWGLNYRRVPLIEKLQFDAARVSSDAFLELTNQTINRLNGLYETAHAEGWPSPGAVDPVLAAAFARAQGDLGWAARAIPSRPKWTIIDAYFTRAGVSGMTDPYFLETLVASDLLPFERPFVVAHEWSHLAGIADEGDANFAGWLTCLRGGAPLQYSAWLFLYDELAGSLNPRTRAIGTVRLADGPRADLLAIRERLRQHVNPRLSAAGWRVYDQYLKANRIPEGAASYNEVVKLILGSRFSPEWIPAMREPGRR